VTVRIVRPEHARIRLVSAIQPDYDTDPVRWGSWQAPHDVHNVAPEPTGPVLDVGCGEGRLASLIGHRVRWIGLDSSPRQLRKSFYRPVVLADTRALPFQSGVFHEVMHLWCLYHVDNPVPAIREAWRLLRSGGRYYACTAARDSDPELMRDGYPPSSLDAEEAESIVASVFVQVELQRWNGHFFPLNSRQEVRAYCPHHHIPLDCAESVEIPLWLTKHEVSSCARENPDHQRVSRRCDAGSRAGPPLKKGERPTEYRPLIDAGNVDPSRIVAEINTTFASQFQLVRRYATGETGAFRVTRANGEKFVLKWSPSSEHLPLIDAAARTTGELQAIGYPAPSYDLWGSLSHGCFSLQGALPGRPRRISPVRAIDRLVELNALQAGRGAWLREAFPRRPAWPEEAAEAVLHGYAEQEYCVLESMRTYSPVTRQVLETLQAFVAAHRAELATVSTGDIVHYDFSPANILLAGGRVTGVVDWDGVRAGDRAFDLATLLYYVYPSAAARTRLWNAAVRISSPGVVAVYLAHVAVRQLDFSIRHHTAEAVARWLLHIQSVIEGLNVA
jgi:SAM-dependent methyltransferase